MSKIFDHLNSTLYHLELPGSWAFWSIAFEPLPTLITSYGAKKGGNSLGTSPKDGNGFSKLLLPDYLLIISDILIVILMSALWPNPTFDSIIEKTANKLTSDIACIAEEMGLLHKFQYINYADLSQNPIGSYGRDNMEFLRKVSRKYDAKGVFQKQAPGGFKLGIKY